KESDDSRSNNPAKADMPCRSRRPVKVIKFICWYWTNLVRPDLSSPVSMPVPSSKLDEEYKASYSASVVAAFQSMSTCGVNERVSDRPFSRSSTASLKSGAAKVIFAISIDDGRPPSAYLTATT